LTAATLAISRIVEIFTRQRLATGIGRTLKHGHFAATHRTEHRAFRLKRRLGALNGGLGSRTGGGRSGFALVRESGRGLPALGGTLHFGGREDIELGLDGGNGSNNSGGRGLRGFGNNHWRNRNRGGRGRGDDRSSTDRSHVGRSERVLVFRLRFKHLHGGGLVGAGGGRVAGGGRRGLGRDAFTARETRAAVGAGIGTPIGYGRSGCASVLGRSPGGRGAGRGII
jgi:hypothetical protein